MKSNQVVTINYVLTNAEGTVLDQTTAGNSFSYLSGAQQILPKLEEAVGAMLIGSKKIVSLAAADAYGEHSAEAIQSIPKKEFPKDVDLKVGMQFVTSAPDGGQMPFVISEVTDEEVTVDFNHPLAGVALTFDVELVDVRDATAEELAHGHAHGAHGQHHH